MFLSVTQPPPAAGDAASQFRCAITFEGFKLRSLLKDLNYVLQT